MKWLEKIGRRTAYRAWLRKLDYVHLNIGIHEGLPPSYFVLHSPEEIRLEREAALAAVNRMIAEDLKNMDCSVCSSKEDI